MLIEVVNLTRNLFSVSVASLLLSFAASCAKGAPSTSTSAPRAPSAKIVILDKNLKKDLVVEKVTGGRTSNRLLYAEAHLRNRSKNELTVQVQTLYTDAKGKPLNPPVGDGAWTSMVIPIASTIPYRSQALDLQAANFTIQLRTLK